MKIKKITVILFAVSLLFSLSACGTSSENSKTNSSVLSSDTKETIENLDFTFISGFSEGLAFIQYNDDNSKTYCIDKKGKVLFSLDGNYNVCCHFSNGIAMVQKNWSDEETCIVNTKGKLTTAKDLGGTQFIINADDYKAAFADGFILLCKSNSDFTGSKDELASLDSSLKVLVPFSREFFENINRDLFLVNGTRYYNGVLYNASGVYKINSMDAIFLDTGKTVKAEDKSSIMDLFGKIGAKNESDFWVYEGDYIVDERTNEKPEAVNATLANYEDTLYEVSFENGKASVLFKVNNSEGEKYYFTIMGEDGKFYFEPIEVISNIIRTDGKSYLFEDNYHGTTVYLQMVNLDGKSFEYSYESEYADMRANSVNFFNETVVLDRIIALNDKLEKLF